MSSHKTTWQSWVLEHLIWVIIGILGTVSIVLYSVFNWAFVSNFLTHTIVDFVRQFGSYGWLAFLALSVIATITPFPDSLLTFASGFLFGPVVGVALSLTGGIIGNSIDFWLARKYGREYVHRKFPKASKTIDAFSKEAGWQSILLLRFTPNPLPFDWISYAAGVSKIKFGTFLVASIIGIAPLQILTILVATNLQNGGSNLLLIVSVAVGMIGITGLFGLIKRYKLHEKFGSF